ncbi:radical SAM protein [Sorangium cellulosum]|nr:radical SAM protein [Sorangium cellulosum]
MTARPPLVLVPQHFGSTVFDRRTSRYLPFDHETTDILLRARATPIGAIVDAAPPERRGALAAFASAFYERAFFTHDLLFDGVALDVTPPEGHLTGPLAVHLEVVAACNLACAHCFAGELPRREPPLTLAELDALFASLARLGSFRLGLTGGEPLLRKDLFDILDLATSHGLHPCLTTNALLLTEETAKKLGERSLVWLNVSLDGATAATNDAVRGEGTFARVLEKVALLREHARFSLAFTIMRHNASEAAAFAELAAAAGAHTAVFRPLYPVGAAGSRAELWPSFDDYEAALGALWTLGATGDGRATAARAIDPFSPRSRGETRAVVHDNWGCGAGNTVCSISVGGDVNPCSFLGPGFVAENLRRAPFEHIWRESERFRAIRGLPGDGAGTASFGGGCRARSLVMAGDVNAPDPWLARHEAAPQRHNPLTVLRAQRRLA